MKQELIDYIRRPQYDVGSRASHGKRLAQRNPVAVLNPEDISGSRRLNIEVDGERYNRNWDGENCLHDQIRNQRMVELGWDVKRFRVCQIRDDMSACVQNVMGWVRGS